MEGVGARIGCRLYLGARRHALSTQRLRCTDPPPLCSALLSRFLGQLGHSHVLDHLLWDRTTRGAPTPNPPALSQLLQHLPSAAAMQGKPHHHFCRWLLQADHSPAEALASAFPGASQAEAAHQIDTMSPRGLRVRGRVQGGCLAWGAPGGTWGASLRNLDALPAPPRAS